MITKKFTTHSLIYLIIEIFEINFRTLLDNSNKVFSKNDIDYLEKLLLNERQMVESICKTTLSVGIFTNWRGRINALTTKKKNFLKILPFNIEFFFYRFNKIIKGSAFVNWEHFVPAFKGKNNSFHLLKS